MQVDNRGLDTQESGDLMDAHGSSHRDDFLFVPESPLGVMAVLSKNFLEHIVV